MKVTPIIAPVMDWHSFVAECHKALGRSPVASLNLAGLKPGLLKTVPAALGEFQKEGTHAIPFLKSRDSDRVLEHLFCSFLVEGSREELSRLLCLAKLGILAPDDSDTVAILTGSLAQWREAILSLSRLNVATEVRQAANDIQGYLNAAGLGDLFAGCASKKQPDGTIILEIK